MNKITDSQLCICASPADVYISWRASNGEFIKETYHEVGLSINEAIEKFKLKHEGK